MWGIKIVIWNFWYCALTELRNPVAGTEGYLRVKGNSHKRGTEVYEHADIFIYTIKVLSICNTLWICTIWQIFLPANIFRD